MDREVYADPAAAEARILATEGEWPEHRRASVLTDCPSYLTARCNVDAGGGGDMWKEDWRAEGAAWLQRHLNEDAQELQVLKQHRIHKPTEDGEERLPLKHCQRRDNPKLCS